MTFRPDTLRDRTRLIVSALAFAIGFWVVDAGGMLWVSNASLGPALLPDGDTLNFRLLAALAFAVAGFAICNAVRRSMNREAFALHRSQQSEQKYRALLASSFECIVMLGRQAEIVELSESAAQLFGGDMEYLAGKSIDNFVNLDPAGCDGSVTTVSSTLRENRFEPQRSIAVSMLAVNGRKFPAEIAVTPVSNSGCSRYVIAIRETTDSVIAKKALRQSETQYRALFDNIPDGVYRSSPDGALLAANPALVNMLGFDSREELLATANTNEFYKDPEQRTKILALLEQKGEARNIEVRLRRRDGETIAALANVRSITDETGAGIVYEGTVSDISDLLQVRAALEDSEEHFRALTENARDIINVIDEQGRIVYSSPSISTVSSRSPQELAGSDFFRGIHADDVGDVRRTIEQSFIRPGGSREFTCRVYDTNRTIRYFESVGTAYLTRDGQLQAVIHSRDVTTRRATESQLRQLQKRHAIDRLTSGITLEFSNLLSSAIGNLETLDDSVDESAAGSQIESAKAACTRAAELNLCLLALTDQENGTTPEVVNVNGVLLDLEPVLRKSLSNEIQVELNLGEELWPVRISRTELEGTLLQLAVHAKNTMSGSGRLAIRTCNRAANEVADGPDGKLGTDAICINVRDMSAVSSCATSKDGRQDPDAADHDDAGSVLGAVKSFTEAAGGKFHLIHRPGNGTTASIVLPRHTTTRVGVASF